MKSKLVMTTAWGTAALALTQPWIAHADEETALEEVVVTAQKREERLIDVPMSISVLSGAELEQRGIESIQDLSFSVPGLTMREDGPGSYTIFLRGLANQSGSGALVGVYLDEAPLSLDGFNQLSPVALDLQRIEVLKGPQGTLYGQASAGGTVRYITNRPKLDRVEGRVEGSLFNVADGELGEKVEGMINVPLIDDKLALRVAGSYERGGGWIDQPEAGIEDGNGTELLNLRAKLLWAPTEAFQAEAMIHTHRADTELGLGYEEPDRTVDIGPDRSKVMIPKEFDYTLYNVELRFDVGFADLVSATTYIDHDHQYPFTYLARPGNFSYGYIEGNDDRWVKADQFSQELRLQSSGDRLDWTLGAFYRDVSTDLLAIYEYGYAPDGDLLSGGGAVYSDLYYYSKDTSESYSVFADAGWHVTDRFTIGAGVRNFHDRQTSMTEYAPGTGPVDSAKFSSTDPRAYASYKYAENGNAYLSVSKGFRSGGFNAPPFAPYDPEKILTYELGTKAALANGALQIDLAVYHTKYDDMVRRRLVTVGGQFLSESSNIGEVEVDGVEVGLAVRPTPSLTLTATGAYIDSAIKETVATDVVNIPGDRTDYTPRLSYTLGANYGFQWGANAPGYFRVDFSHRDEVTYIDRSSFFAEVLPQSSQSLDLLGARLGAQINDLDVELFALNLTDQNRSIDPYTGWANANRTRPRTIGVKVGYQF
jgi:iron complex outermembrane receptor protein